MKIVAIIQARCGSSRFPEKVLKKIGNKIVLNHVFDRIKKSNILDDYILATTHSEKDDKIVEWAKNNSVKFFRGSEDDVLSRYYHAAIKFNADIIVRVTSDCPFIDPEILDLTINHFMVTGAEYSSNVHPPTFPDGYDVEVLTFNALESAFKNATTTQEREHVTPYIWNKNSNFSKSNFINSLGDMSDLRFTLDYKEDLEFLNKVYEKIDEYSSFKDVMSVLENNQHLIDINKSFKRNENF
jgi:spore coat polysaccharide biosynthesis protein SpsF